MKLSLYVIFEELQKNSLFQGNLISSNISDSSKSLLTNVRLLSDAGMLDHLRPEYLYLVEDTSISDFHNFPNHSFLFLHSSVPVNSAHIPFNAIYIPNQCSASQLLSAIQTIFETYQGWEQEMIQCLIQKHPVQELMDIAARPLLNPIALFDNASTCISYAGPLPEPLQDDLWRSVLQKDFIPPSVVNRDLQSRLYHLTSTSHRPFSQFVSANEQQVIVPLWNEHKSVAHIGTTNINHFITKGQFSLLCSLQPIFEATITNLNDFFLYDEKSSYYILQVLKGESVNLKKLERILRFFNWNTNEPFRVIVFSASDNMFSLENSMSFITRKISDAIKTNFIFSFENDIVAIMRESQFSSLADLKAVLNDRLELFALKIGISFCNRSFLNLRTAYLQGKAALQYGAAALPSKWCIPFDENYIDCILNMLYQAEPYSEVLYHPAVLQLMHDHPECDFSYLETLKAFILNGQNFSKTANALHIHRNTLVYRINKLEELLGIHLDQLSLTTLFQLLISCILSEHEAT